MARLEEELNFKLFDRVSGRLVPRAEAEYFLEEAEDILRRLEQSRQAMRDVAATRLGKLRLACLPAASDVFVPRMVSRFLQDRQGVSVSIMMRSSAEIWEHMAAQQYDIGLAEISSPRRGVDQRPIDLRSVCALPRDHPLAAEKQITPTMLSGEPAAALYGDHSVAVRTRDRFREAEARFIQRFELQTFMPALEQVGQGLCYCVCDPMTAVSYQLRNPDPERQDIVFRPFFPTVPCPAAILTPTQQPLSRLAEAFVELLTQELHGLMARFEPPG